MAKLIIMQGLPASGKSTKAKELVETMGNAVRINKDLLRTMLHFDKFTGPKESRTKDASRKLADWFLANDVNVIIDDTNLKPSTLQSWKDLAKIHQAKVEVVKMETTMQECLDRDKKREKKVGEFVIVGMALQYGLYPNPKKGFVLCDLDGTLCDIEHRRHFVENGLKDWKGFFAGISDDVPRAEVVKIVLQYEKQGFDIIFVTARPEEYREVTEAWLEKCFAGYKPHKVVLMRRSGDMRPDTEVKKQILDTYFSEPFDIHVVIDDRPSVIRMWKENGIDVIDVGDGCEF